MNPKVTFFFLIFWTMNLAFVPLLSLYGLRVCPILSIPGFGFGCYYSAAFILTSNLLNSALIWFTIRGANKNQFAFVQTSRNFYGLVVVAYFGSTAVALLLLQFLLKINHLSTSSRAPEILTFASLLLGITQIYGLHWALDGWPPNYSKNPSFKGRWFAHAARTMFPVVVTFAVLLHFVFSQALGFNEGKTAPIVSHDDFITHVSYVIGFLVSWLLITFCFYFMAEREQVARVQRHLKQLSELDVSFRSESKSAWGLWAALLEQLNIFSKILGERTRLLKTFSRFVTAGIAEQALQQELRETAGSAKELTVMMSDIRNFTGISEKLSPQQVVTLLNEYFSAMLDVISYFQVNVDKFIGDGILSYIVSKDKEIELPSDKQNQMAVNAALAMIDQVEKLNLRLEVLNLPAIKIGVGIFRGPLVIGLIGSEAKLQHTIIGDTVNRAARLESLCKELGVSIVISEGVFYSLNEDTKRLFHSFGKQSIKGLSDLMEVFGGPI